MSTGEFCDSELLLVLVVQGDTGRDIERHMWLRGVHRSHYGSDVTTQQSEAGRHDASYRNWVIHILCEKENGEI